MNRLPCQYLIETTFIKITLQNKIEYKTWAGEAGTWNGTAVLF